MLRALEKERGRIVNKVSWRAAVDRRQWTTDSGPVDVAGEE
jgi:hypothetical protein